MVCGGVCKHFMRQAHVCFSHRMCSGSFWKTPDGYANFAEMTDIQQLAKPINGFGIHLQKCTRPKKGEVVNMRTKKIAKGLGRL